MVDSWEFDNIENIDVMTCSELVSFLIQLKFQKEDVKELESKLIWKV